MIYFKYDLIINYKSTFKRKSNKKSAETALLKRVDNGLALF